jgi:hypothetical protein
MTTGQMTKKHFWQGIYFMEYLQDISHLREGSNSGKRKFFIWSCLRNKYEHIFDT